MTPREQAEWLEQQRESRLLWRAEMERLIEEAINAAVEEDRKTRQHQFIGRTDRGCELCGEPDRDEIHIYSRDTYRNWLKLAVEEEREACAQIAEKAIGATRREIAAEIRARKDAA